MPDQQVGLRGNRDRTRLEAFVDAAFAFAVALLLVIGSAVPDSPAELGDAVRRLPAAAASFAMVTMFWYDHVRWSRRFDADSSASKVLSLLLVFLILTFVQPLSLLFDTFFGWISGGRLAAVEVSPTDLIFIYASFAVAFVSLSACVGGLYFDTWRRRASSSLTIEQSATAAGQVAVFVVMVAVGIVSFASTLLLLGTTSPWVTAIPGLVYFLSFLTGPVEQFTRRRVLREHQTPAAADGKDRADRKRKLAAREAPGHRVKRER